MARHGHFEPQALRQARVAAGFTQHELARMLGVAGGERVSRWELGRSAPRLDTLARAAAVLSVDVESLLVGGEDHGELRSLRQARGLTLAELAHQVHVSKSTISRWETGQGSRELPPGIVRLLADALGVSLSTVRTAIGHPRLN